MDRSPASLLNERQKQCLRLVYQNLEAKEIARRLELSPHTVNEHLRDARQAMGVSRSIHAARLLAEVEGDNRIVSEPFGIAAAGANASPTTTQPATPAAAFGGNRYNLSVLQRLGLIVAIAVGIIALGGALLTAFDAVTRTMKEHRLDLAEGPYRPR